MPAVERLRSGLVEYLHEHECFPLSRFLESVAPGADQPLIRRALWPLFTELDLVTGYEGGALTVSRKQTSEPRVPDPRERTLLEAFFQRPAVPPDMEAAVLEYISRKTGKPWNEWKVLERIRAAVAFQKGEYWKEGESRRISYRKAYRVLAYLAYQSPVYLVQGEYLLYSLALQGLFLKHMRVLDVGTGPGVVPMALIDLHRRLGKFTADLFVIEQSEEFLEAFRTLVPPLAPRDGSIRVHPPLQRDLRETTAADLPPSLDLIIFQNVLNELPGAAAGDRASLVCEYSRALSRCGSILLIEPADLVNSTELRKTAMEAAKGGLSLHGPCRFLWGSTCRPERCWSFLARPGIAPTRLMEALSEGPGGYRYRNTDIKFSYAILRKTPAPGMPGIPLSPREYVRLSALSRHVNRRINVAAAVMSGNLGDRKASVYLLCDGTTQKPVYAVLPAYHRGPQSIALSALAYGQAARFSSVLVRYNPAHDAYNLLVTRESGVREWGGANGGKKKKRGNCL